MVPASPQEWEGAEELQSNDEGEGSEPRRGRSEDRAKREEE